MVAVLTRKGALVSTSGEIRVSTAVMAHPARREQAEQLLRRHPELNAQVAFDPDPGGKPATLRTAVAAWSRVGQGATHHLVMQEDVQLCHDFHTAMHQALSVAPRGAIALFSNWTHLTAQAVRLAALCGASWTPAVDTWAPTQALILPADVAGQFAQFAERYSQDKPDNRAMAEFLADRGLTTYVAIPNLVEHRPTPSLLFNDLLYGVRNSVVFPESADVGPAPFTDRVVAPPAVACMGLGDFESMCHYEPLTGGPEAATAPGAEVLIIHGMSAPELAEGFASDLDYHPEATATGLGESLMFQLWITTFLQGHLARGLTAVDAGPTQLSDLDAALQKNRWARVSLATFPAGALRMTFPRSSIREVAEQLTPLCTSALRAGFAAVDHWPGLAALWRPDVHEIRPQWNVGVKVQPR
jgi:hypothetical protein